MATVNRITTALFDTLFAVMESWPGWLSLVVLSALTGIIALVVYKYTSNQTAIGRVHDDIRVALLAAKLFKDDLGVTLRSQGKLFGAATRLFLYSLVPLAVMTPPMILLLTQMAPRYEWQPFRPGDEVQGGSHPARRHAQRTGRGRIRCTRRCGTPGESRCNRRRGARRETTSLFRQAV
jgi:hypothetical protein